MTAFLLATALIAAPTFAAGNGSGSTLKLDTANGTTTDDTAASAADAAAPSSLQGIDDGGTLDLPQSLQAQKADLLLKKLKKTRTGETPNEPGDDMLPTKPAKKLKKLEQGKRTDEAKIELSPIEKELLLSPSGADKDVSSSFKIEGLTQFGYSYFKPDQQTFDALTDIPVGANYVLGAGDRISLTIWGSIDDRFDLKVNRSGDIILPRVGPVKVAGVPFSNLHALIRGSLARVYKDFNINVTMGKLRMMKIFVVGEVVSPGDYTISSLSTVINALSAASGPTKNGSLRTIQVKRDGKTVAHVDLYDFFARGDKSCDIQLQPGDTIFVPSIGPVAAITGNVRRPAIYEIKDEKSLKDLIVLAGGVTSSGYLHHLQVARIEAHEKKVVTDLDIDPKSNGKSLEEVAASLPLQDMDLVKVYPIDSKLRNYARVDGYVLRPGDYALKPGMRISQVLADASLLPEFYREAGQIDRTIPPDNHHEIVNFNVGKALSGDPAHDLVLQEFDQIMVFSRWEMEEMPMVKITGEVQKPGEYRLFDNMTLRDLVIKAGNPKKTAYLKNTEIVRLTRSGEAVVATPININLEAAIKGDPKDNVVLQPFDEVLIRKIPNWKEVVDSYINLKGEFVFPGVYPVYKGEKLSNVIRRAGGFTDKAYLKGAKFTREQIRDVQQKRMDEVLSREEMNISRKQGELASVAASKEELDATKASLEGLKNAIEMLKKKKAEGRLIITLLPENEFRDSAYDFEVQAGDILEVPADPKVVSVFGQVYNPSSYQYLAGESVSGYLGKSGGFTRDAEEDDTYVIKADGSVVSRQMSSGFLFFGTFMNKELDSGDTVVVPQKLEKTAWLRDIKDITTIISQIAISAGVVFAAGL
jgi:protein involved in polysaccharide export with SLBB domain